MRTDDYFRWYENDIASDYDKEWHEEKIYYGRAISSGDDFPREEIDYCKGLKTHRWIKIRIQTYLLLGDDEFADWADEPVLELADHIREKFFGGHHGIIGMDFDYHGFIRELVLEYDEEHFHCTSRLLAYLEEKELMFSFKEK